MSSDMAPAASTVDPMTSRKELAADFRAARARAGLSQEMVAARMRALGYGAWRYQTVGAVEKGKRRLMAEEVMALACVMETTIAALMGYAASPRWP